MSNVSLINGHIDEPNTCGKCIHYEICSPYTAPNESYPEVNGCKCFKAKEDMVEVVRKSVKGYEGYYEVDQFGRVYSLDRTIFVNGNGRQYNKPLKSRQLKQGLHTKGYKTVALTKDGKTKSLFVHRLVAEAFIPNENNLPMVNHKDEDRTNNFVENLEWCTASYNRTYGNAIKNQAKNLIGRKHTKEHNAKISLSMKKYRDKERAEKGYCDNGKLKSTDFCSYGERRGKE